MGEARKILGTAIGQNINTEGTVFYMLETIKKLLMVKHRGVWENLSLWVFT
jgi:hypothetical protein